MPLHQSQGAGTTNAPQTAAPAKPGKPIDMAQMEAMNHRVQSFNVARSPVDRQELKDAQQHFQNATDALKAGDYKKAEVELGALGFPLPAGRGPLGHAASVSAILLGTPAHQQGRGLADRPHKRSSAPGSERHERLCRQREDDQSPCIGAGRHFQPTDGDAADAVYARSQLGGLHVARQRRRAAPGGGIGHMLGVFKAPDGTIWVTSNEDFHQVNERYQGRRDAGRPRRNGEAGDQRDVPRPGYRAGSRFSSAATANLPSTGDPAVDSIRRSTEMGVMRRSEVLIPRLLRLRLLKARPCRATAAAGRRSP